ncbi:MAG: hypothetical protein EZS28_042098, partial [Streblomastix strix]
LIQQQRNKKISFTPQFKPQFKPQIKPQPKFKLAQSNPKSSIISNPQQHSIPAVQSKYNVQVGVQVIDVPAVQPQISNIAQSTPIPIEDYQQYQTLDLTKQVQTLAEAQFKVQIEVQIEE